MKKIVWIMIIMSTTLFSLDWSKDLNTAFKRSKASGKPLMVFVEGAHCRWCKKMKHRTLADKTIEKRLKNYVLVKVKREDKKSVKLLPKIQGVPVIFFMTPKQKVLETVLGYWDVWDFLSYIDDVEVKLKKYK